MHDSTCSAVGNILKEGVPFLHNFGEGNTFLGINAGNLTLTGFRARNVFLDVLPTDSLQPGFQPFSGPIVFRRRISERPGMM